MSSKNLKGNFEAQEQSNKKHRVKSKKLEKREHKKKNKKKTKKERHYIHTIQKHIRQEFKKERKFISFDTLPFDLIDIEKYLKRLIEIDPNSTSDIVELITNMENKGVEIDIGELENKLVQSCLVKLFKKLRIYSIGLKNPFIFKIKKVDKKLNRERFTTDEAEIISDSLESYSLFINAFLNFIKNHENKSKEELEDDEDEQSVEASKDNDINSEIDQEYEALEKSVGLNAELINKAFNVMMRNDDLIGKKRKTSNEVLSHSKNLVKKNIIISENTELALQEDQESDDDYVGPKASDFLKSTYNLIEDAEDFDNLINNITKPSKSVEPVRNTQEDKRYLVSNEKYNKILKENNEYLQTTSNYSNSNKTLMEEHLENKKLNNSKLHKGRVLDNIQSKAQLVTSKLPNLNSRFEKK